jgi:hypothetical protein
MAGQPHVRQLLRDLVVWVQFSVYVFAGINKLVYGWEPWTHGTALQNLAFDSSMHDFARGTHVPYAVSLVRCYATLFQRLVVPFGFFRAKYRLWSVWILGTMHVGYAILMNVNLFPVVGVASLLMVCPPRDASAPEDPSPAEGLRALRAVDPRTRLQVLVMGAFVAWLLVEPVRLALSDAMAWENKLMVVPAWRMFADGGVAAGSAWRLVFVTRHGKVDATDISLELLPHTWRDRFVVDAIFHEVASQNAGPNSLATHLALSAEDTYRARERARGTSAGILGSVFDLYSTR